MERSDIDLTGQVALVTGGGGGIGRAGAYSLAAMGADVAVLDSNQQRCDEAVAHIEAMGRKALGICANAMEVDAVRAAVLAVKEKFGRLDILVNNVGGVNRRAFLDLTEKNWHRHIALNLVSHLAATSEAVPIMIEGGRGGSIVNVSSIEGSRAAPGYAVYAACKAGLNNFTRTLAVELSDHGIRVNAIAPDYIATPGTRGAFTGSADESNWMKVSAAHDESVRKRIPLGRAGIESECGKLIGFLASPAASYITGTIIPVDGGSWASSGWIRDSKGEWILPPEAE
jgi:NAD(P)-dependent dehydrogenase (short-subunit alcohol dehydrogenase family)